MDAKLPKGMNEHLKLEFKAAHEYLAMSVWLSSNDLPGFATWMRQQSADELTHAQKFIDHIVERDDKAVLPAVALLPWPCHVFLAVLVRDGHRAHELGRQAGEVVRNMVVPQLSGGQ